MSPPCPERHLTFERIFIMKSNFIAAAVVAVAALTSVAASAESFNPYLFDQMQAPSTRTRAEVKAELQQAQREGYNVTLSNAYQSFDAGVPAGNKTRSEVKAEATAFSQASVSAIEHGYPVVQ
jgi:hypothetical protein